MASLENMSSTPTACIHQLFEARAAERPNAIAVTSEGDLLTYAELDDAANAIAQDLHALGATTETLIALCLERGAPMVTAIVGILKAGAAYVPLDPVYPEERLRFLLSDTRTPIVVTTRALASRLPSLAEGQRRVYLLDERISSKADPPAASLVPPKVEARPENAAYVIYTSGSTGTPKGVVVEHRHVVRLFSAVAHEFAFGPDDVWTLFHSFGFDFSVWELWGALLHGGRVVIVPSATARAPATFLDLLARENVTVLSQTPSAFQQLAKTAALTAPALKLALRYVVFGGEALDPQVLRDWVERHGDSAPVLVNMYGITETTVHVTYRRITRTDTTRAGVSPIGRPLRDLFVRLLDASGNPVARGQAGELYVGGAGVARGYLHRPELTAERFVIDVSSGTPDARLYRSGDLAIELPDGELAYVGRADAQLKIRGYRIEPGEIESCLRQHASVSNAVVAARDLGEGDMDLVAYVVPSLARPSGLIDELRALAARHLPEHMRPCAYVILDEMPLTANGKLDRTLLPAPARASFVSAPAKRMPTSPIERTLAEIWRGVLGVPEVGLEDDFFELGGTSLGAIKVLLSVKERLGVSLDMALWADVSTVAGLAGACCVLSAARAQSHEVTAERQPRG